jgi:hypothetical protein
VAEGIQNQDTPNPVSQQFGKIQNLDNYVRTWLFSVSASPSG